MTMIILNGSEKQIAWATAIREASVEKWNALLAEAQSAEKRFSRPVKAWIIEKLPAAIEAALAVDSASKWIDSRDFDDTAKLAMVNFTVEKGLLYRQEMAQLDSYATKR